jgi:homoserine kinase
VRLERLLLSSDKDILVGTVAVQNISFQKLVVAHFILDCWKTTSELVAEYKNDKLLETFRVMTVTGLVSGWI